MQRRVASGILTLHLAFVIAATQAPLGSGGHAPNLVPFRSMARDWSTGGHGLIVNFAGNILVFAPFGFLLPLARSRLTSALQVAAACFAVSAAIEVAQYAIGLRVADVDDVLLNVSGGLLGYLVLGLSRRPSRAESPTAADVAIAPVRGD